MSTSVAVLRRGSSESITVTAIPPGALEFITARLSPHGGSVKLWEFEDRGMTEIAFIHPSDPKGVKACRSIVGEWCEANFPGTPVRRDIEGRHRRR